MDRLSLRTQRRLTRIVKESVSEAIKRTMAHYSGALIFSVLEGDGREADVIKTYAALEKNFRADSWETQKESGDPQSPFTIKKRLDVSLRPGEIKTDIVTIRVEIESCVYPKLQVNLWIE